MIKTITFSILTIIALSSFPVSHASIDNKLVFGLEVRFRYEFQDNFNQKYYGDDPKQGSSDDGFLLGRFRAGFNYRPCEKIHLALWAQDSEAWGMALPDSAFYNAKPGCEHNPNQDHWELSNTYLEIKKPFDVPLTLKGGRQRIAYGNNRIFGPGQWGNTGRWIWDAVKVSYRLGKGFVDAYYGRTMVHQADVFSLSHRHFYDSWGVYSHFVLPPNLLGIIFEPFIVTKRDNHDNYTGKNGVTGPLDTYYTGIRAFRKDICGLDVDMTYVRQFGDYAQDRVKAYGFHVLLGYHIKHTSTESRLTIEYSFGSGDSDPTDGDHETFDGAFGARDKMYGRMNLFHWMNIQDAQANLETKACKWCYLKAELHKFWLAQKKDAWYLNAMEYIDKTGNSGDEVGMELDIVMRFDLPKNNDIQIGYGHFWPDEFAENKASDQQADWIFFQWTYRFSQGIL